MDCNERIRTLADFMKHQREFSFASMKGTGHAKFTVQIQQIQYEGHHGQNRWKALIEFGKQYRYEWNEEELNSYLDEHPEDRILFDQAL
jgi:hypothetical protein